MAQFYLRPQWSITNPEEISTNMKHFLLESYKQGLLVYNQEIVYYLRKKLNKWQIEWKILETQLPQYGLRKCIANNNGEIYVSAAIGNLYHLELLPEEVKINSLYNNHENSIDFVILKGIKDECLIQLTTNHCLKAIEMFKYHLYSSLEIPDSNTIVAHNTGPYLMVGTTKGRIHFLNYTNIKEPFEITSIETDKSHPIGSLQLMDQYGVYRSIYYNFYLLKTDFTNQSFYEITDFEHITEKMGICQYFLAENNYIFMFINRNSRTELPHCEIMLCYQWLPLQKSIKRLEYELPHIYRDIGEIIATTKNIVEFFAVRLESNILDYLNFKMDSNELVIVHSVQTHHLCNINGITSSKNLLTWGVDGTYIHYRSHKKSPKAYGICQILQIKYRPRVVQKVLDCFNGK